jgi:ABC-type transporter Mla subunit MlaD
MNKQQREKISDMLDEIEGYVSTLETEANEEQEKRDNMPESLWDTERGQAIQDAADNLQQAADDLQNWIDETRANLEL